MIYYYFGGKEGLYHRRAGGGLQRASARIEATLDLEHQPPDAGAARAGRLHLRLPERHPEFVRLVMNENILNGVHMARSKAIGELNARVIDALRESWRAASRPGVFRRDIDPVDLHMSISALVHLQRRQPRHLLDHLQARHGLAAGARRAARPGRRHHPALRRQPEPARRRTRLPAAALTLTYQFVHFCG